MDLSSQKLREVEFSEKLRGYHPREVDDFLEEVAVGVDELVARLHASQAAARTAEAVGATTPQVDQERDSAFDEGTVARTLLLAQRTADLAIREAEELGRNLREQAQAEAYSLVQEAQSYAAAVTAEARAAADAAITDVEQKRINAERDIAVLRDQAQAEADRLVQEAETYAAAVTTEAEAAADAAITDLEQKRISLEREFASLRARAVQQRDGLREMLSDRLLALDGWLTANAEAETQQGLGPVPGVDHLPRLELKPDPDEQTVDLASRSGKPPSGSPGGSSSGTKDADRAPPAVTMPGRARDAALQRSRGGHLLGERDDVGVDARAAELDHDRPRPGLVVNEHQDSPLPGKCENCRTGGAKGDAARREKQPTQHHLLRRVAPGPGHDHQRSCSRSTASSSGVRSGRKVPASQALVVGTSRVAFSCIQGQQRESPHRRPGQQDVHLLR